MSVTPEIVRAVVFDKAPFGKRGYHESQVDDFLDRVEARLEGTGSLTSSEVRKVVFDAAPRIKRGYHEDQVDDFLDMVAMEIDEREERGDHTQVIPPVAAAPAHTPPPARAPGPAHAQPPRPGPLTPEPDGEVAFLPLPPAPPGVRGYKHGDVDRLARAMRHAATSYNGRPTAAELVNTPLGLTYFAGQGYHPAAVDALVQAWATELRHRES